jgi:hypothetical protein
MVTVMVRAMMMVLMMEMVMLLSQECLRAPWCSEGIDLIRRYKSVTRVLQGCDRCVT